MKLVILDRDGVINEESAEFVKTPDEWQPIDGSLDAIARLTRQGWIVTVATNQSGIARGLLDLDALHAINAKMAQAVRAAGGELHGVFFCPHHPDDRCDCRKPKPGLLHQIALLLGVSLEGVPMIGDSERDIRVAQAVGARPLLVLTGDGVATREALGDESDVEVFADLASAVTFLEGLGRGLIMLVLRSAVFTLLLFLSVLVFSIPAALSFAFPHRVGYHAARGWARTVLWMLDKICGLRHEVEGLGNLPDEPCVVLVKHQSTWETVSQIAIFPRQAWVLKRELMWVPFLGWGLKALKPIAIDRNDGSSALEQIVKQGQVRLRDGMWVVVFPEGTRVRPGQMRRYGRGGAALARAAGRPVIPVAHNAGEFWPRRSLLKHPGVIRMRIGPPIETAERRSRDINEEARDWIERQMAEISAVESA